MATYLWSSLADNQVVAFAPATDVLRFDFSVILATDVTVQAGTTPGTTLFSYNGKTVTLQTDLFTLTTGNVTFDSPTFLIVGDNDIGTAGDHAGVTIIGGPSYDHIIGGNGADFIDGAEGGGPLTSRGDLMAGGAGNDTYVAELLDRVVEAKDEGIDTVRSIATSYTLPDHVENLILMVDTPPEGFAGINGTGNAASNTITGSEAVNEISGLAGNDHLQGRGGADTLYGGIGNDRLEGDDGNDQLEGGAGADALNGGAGLDYARYKNATAALTVDLANAGANTGEAAGDTFTLVEGIVGSRFNDGLFGNANGNDIAAGDGNDYVRGRAGDDNLQGMGGNDNLVGDAGADRLNGGAGFDSARYDTSTVAVLASFASPGQNTGDAAGDSYTSIEGLVGSAFNDTLVGDDAGNVILGLDGNDTIQGRGGNDTLLGANGSDRVEGGAGADSLDGGDGFDYAAYGYSTAAVKASLAAPGTNTGDAAGDAYLAIEGLIGTRLGDLLQGDANVNDLAGGDGDDELAGLGGNDNLQGGNGDDSLDGGAGADRFAGGAGNDKLTFLRAQANGDMLTDFAGNGAAAGDRLVFQGYGAGATFVQVDATHWTINSGDGLVHDTITLANAAAVHATDYTFI